MTSALAARSRRFEIGRVVEQTFGSIGRNFIGYAFLSLLLAGLPAGVTSWFQWQLLQAGSTSEGTLSGVGMLVGSLVSLVTLLLLQAALTFGTVEDLNGRKPGLGRSLSAAAAVLPPLIGIILVIVVTFVLAILVTMGPASMTRSWWLFPLGFLVLLVGGVILSIMFLVTVPAEVVERAGVFGAFRRSLHLTQGARWRIFALVVIYVVAAWIISVVVGAITLGVIFGGAGTGSNLAGGLLAARLNPVALVLGVLVRSVLTLVSSVGVAVIYYELRRAREGISPEYPGGSVRLAGRSCLSLRRRPISSWPSRRPRNPAR